MSAKRSKEQILLDLIEGVGTKQTGCVYQVDINAWVYAAELSSPEIPLGLNYAEAKATAARLGKDRKR